MSHAWKCVPTAISSGVNITKVASCHVVADELSVRVAKITLRIGVS